MIDGTGGGPRGLAAYLLKVQYDKRLTSRQLALRAGISPNTLSSWLRGIGHPRADTLQQVARRLRLDEEEMLAAAGYSPQGEAIRTGSRAEMVEAITRMEREMQAMTSSIKDQLRELRATLMDEDDGSGVLAPAT